MTTTIFAFVAALLVGLKPPLLAHWVLVAGFLLPFVWRDRGVHFVMPSLVSLALGGAFFTWALVSMQWSLMPAKGFYDLTLLLVLFWTFYQLWHNAPPSQQALKAMVLGTLAALFILSIDLCFHQGIQRALRNVPWDKPNMEFLTSSAMIAMPLLLWPLVAYLRQQNMPRLALGLWLAYGGLTLLGEATAGRLSFAVGSLAFAIALWQPQLVRLGMMIAIVVGFGAAVPLAGQAYDWYKSQPVTINGSFAQRLEIWQFAAHRIAEKPLMGWGIQSARAVPNGNQVSDFLKPWDNIIPIHPHNWFLHGLLELGTIGAGLLTGLWLWWLWQIQYLPRRLQPTILAVAGSVMVAGLVSISLWQVWYWAILVLSLLFIRLLQHEIHRTGQ